MLPVKWMPPEAFLDGIFSKLKFFVGRNVLRYSYLGRKPLRCLLSPEVVSNLFFYHAV